MTINRLVMTEGVRIIIDCCFLTAALL